MTKNHRTVETTLLEEPHDPLPLPQIKRLPALMTHVVLRNIFIKLSVNDLKLCRSVCKTWNAAARSVLSQKSVRKFGKFIKKRAKHPHCWGWFESNVEVEKETLEDAKSFVEFVGQRDPVLGLQYRNFVIHTFLLTSMLPLSPHFRDTVTTINIPIYIDQLVWLKQCIQALPSLKGVTAKMFYDLSLRQDSENNFQNPQESATSSTILFRKDLALEEVTIRVVTSWKLPSGQGKFTTTQENYLLEADAFSYWLIRRSPNLTNFHFHNFYRPGIELQRITQEYRGPGFKSLGISSFISNTVTRKPTTALQQFLRLHCATTLRTLQLHNRTDVDLKALFQSPDFPRAMLHTLDIRLSSNLQISDCNCEFLDDLYVFTEKNLDETEDMNENVPGDYLNVFPLRNPLHNLQDLRITIVKHIAMPPGLLEASWFIDGRPTNKRYMAVTSRIFPKVRELSLDIQCSESGICYGSIRVDIVQHLPAAFPALKNLTLYKIDPSLYNAVVLNVPANLESLKIEGMTSWFTVTDNDFLAKGALSRLQDLKEFSFKEWCYEFTDAIIFEGFLKLPLLRILKLPFSRRGRIEFTDIALDALQRHLDVYECCTWNVRRKPA